MILDSDFCMTLRKITFTKAFQFMYFCQLWKHMPFKNVIEDILLCKDKL